MKIKAKKILTAGAASCALAASSAFAMPSMALAEGKEGIAVILPNMIEFVPMLVAFIVVAIILGKFGWPIVEGILVKREETVKESLEKSEQARIEAERVLAEYREQLDQARQEAATIVSEAKQSGEAVRAEVIAKAQAEADQIVAKARQQIETEKKAAIAELQAGVADLTVAVTARLIGEDFSDEDHRKLIQRSIDKAGSLNV